MLARLRADAAFAIPVLFDLLDAEGCDHAIRIKGDSKLHEQVAFLTKRRPGRPPHHVVRQYLRDALEAIAGGHPASRIDAVLPWAYRARRNADQRGMRAA